MIKILILLGLLVSCSFSFTDENNNNEPTKNKSITPKMTNTETTIDLDNLQKAWLKGGTNKSIKIMKFNPLKIVHVRTRINNKTTIFLPDGDQPIANPLGDPAGFKIEYLKSSNSKFKLDNVFTIIPLYSRIDTNLVIIGVSGRVYNFYLYSTKQNAKLVPHSTIYITLNGKVPKVKKLVDLSKKDLEIKKLKIELHTLSKELDLKKQDSISTLSNFDLSNLQLDYKFTTQNNHRLKAVWNDKQFTYFKFKDDFQTPKLFAIDSFKNKVNITYSIFDNILRVKKLSKKWALKIKDEILEVSKIRTFSFKETTKSFIVDMTKAKFNFNILETKNDSFKPKKIFHDKEFTYFEFDTSSNFSKFPSIYRVIDNFDNPIDFEIVGNFMIVKTLHKKFTLRLGEKHICIRYNDE